MSFFAVTFEQVDQVLPHPRADRLEIIKLRGLTFQCVVQKGKFHEGDQAIYFPVDSLIPAALLERIGLTGRLSGAGKNRVKTIQLRGEVSQGIAARPEEVCQDLYDGGDLTAYLGVTKYEPPERWCTGGTLLALPEYNSKYDIEGAERHQDIIDLLMDQDVAVLEKVEGSNGSVTRHEGRLYCNQRSNTIVETEGSDNTYWRVARESGLLAFVETFSPSLPRNISVYWELLGPGVQGNIYGFPKPTLRIYDVKLDWKWMDYRSMKQLITDNLGSAWLVPELFVGKLRDFLAGRTVQEASDGKSVLADCLREGIVITPLKEQEVPGYGRLKIKQRSPRYLQSCEN